jgi:predicted nucleic acid-binding protein
MKVLIDTNVIIDALTGREPFNTVAEQIFIMAANQIADMYITASSATDIYYLVRKHLHSTEQAKNVMGKLFELFNILAVTGEDCIAALSGPMKDYEDAVVSTCAYRNQIEYVVTRNLKDYEQSKVRAIMPGDLLVLLTNEED